MECCRKQGYKYNQHYKESNLSYLIEVPLKAWEMRGRLIPLLEIASVITWMNSDQNVRNIWRIQFHDEDPNIRCLKFDAPISYKERMIPDPYALATNGYAELRESLDSVNVVKWEDRHDTIYWRGSSTGINGLNLKNLELNRRVHLCNMGRRIKSLDAKITAVVQAETVETKDKVLQILANSDLLAPNVEPTTFAQNKWIVDIDGNVNSWGYLWKLMSGSCVLKVESGRKEWFYDEIEPYVHMVPIKSDLSNIEQQINWCLENSDKCREISLESKKLGERISRNIGKQVLRSIKEY